MVEQEIRIKQIIESLPDAIVVGDISGNVKYLNPASIALLGYSAKDAMGRPLSDIVTLVDENTDEAIPSIGLKAILSGQDETAGGNALLIGRDGMSELPVEVVARPLRTPDNTINGALLTIHDVRLARFSRKQLSWNASHDPLTGIYNKFEFDRQASALLLTAKRDKSHHALLLVDLDHFRHLNEMADHNEGDNLLIQVAQLLRGVLRANDSVFRSSADRFLILLPHCQIATAEKIADNIRQQIENIVVDLGNGHWPVTASVGITTISEEGAATATQFLHEVESASFAAKQNGRNQISVFNSEKSKQYNKELLSLKTAINNGDFRLYYQMIKATGSGLPLCEILLRRVDALGNEHEPASFLPICERSGLIVELDAWVVRNLLEMLAFNPSLAQQFARIHINLSAYSFASSSFLEEMRALISNYRLPFGLVCFEVSEASVMKNLNHAQHFMNALAELGCRFVLDDVDADLTAFDTVANLPIDMIKIDGSLIQQIKTTQSSAILVRAINEMAKNADMKTVAQQVEDFNVYEWLQDSDIDFVQGFVLHAPLPIETLIYH
jgi:diguanylate cyclase (GGDEF)-like protein/PAS domain S-box-containing protein